MVLNRENTVTHWFDDFTKTFAGMFAGQSVARWLQPLVYPRSTSAGDASREI